MDFDSTITEESTLIKLYMLSNLFRDKDKRNELEKISNEFYTREEELKRKTYPKIVNCLSYKKFDDFLKNTISIINDYEKEIIIYEIQGMRLVEPFLYGIEINDIANISSKIKTRTGFKEFTEIFNKNDRYIISCNWSDIFINFVCKLQVPQKNIFSNKLAIQNNKCVGFDYRR